MMDKSELDNYFKNHHYSVNYLDISTQLRYLVEKGIIDEEELEKRTDFT